MSESLPKLNLDEIAAQLDVLTGWSIDKSGSLYREFKFVDFAQAFSFMTCVAKVAEDMDHHPDWTNVYNRVSVRLLTHDAGGITMRDIELARQMNALSQM